MPPLSSLAFERTLARRSTLAGLRAAIDFDEDVGPAQRRQGGLMVLDDMAGKGGVRWMSQRAMPVVQGLPGRRYAPQSTALQPGYASKLLHIQPG